MHLCISRTLPASCMSGPAPCPCMTAVAEPVLPACGHTAAARPGGPSPSSVGQLPSQLRAHSLAPSCQRGDFLRHSVQGLRAICQCCCERESGVHCSTWHTDRLHVSPVHGHCVCFSRHLLTCVISFHPQSNAMTQQH